MKGRTLVVAVLAWLGVVAIGSGVTWLVIDSAGQRVLAESAPAPVAGPTQDLFPSGPVGPSRLPRPSSPGTGPSAPASSAAPTTPAPGGRPSQSPTSPRATSQEPGRTTSPEPSYQQRTWRGSPGSVVARCSGQTVSLQSATPADGYRVEVGGRGPTEVEVTFKGNGREVKVRARCSGGVPSFGGEGDSGHEDD